MSVDVSTTIGDLVSADPRRSRVLETYGVDYCCNGRRSLAEATDYAYLAILTGLKEMQLDLPELIQKENNIVYPQDIELEQRLAGR